MQWVKKGLIYNVDSSNWWSKKYALYPTPFFIEERNVIRIYFGTVDENIFGRISFIEVSADNPSIINYNPNTFIVDIGEKGAFDDCGVSPASAIMIDNKLHLYYSGFCRSYRTPYHIFSGLAIEQANQQYKKLGDVPVLDRTNGECFDKGGPVVLFDDGIYKTWYVSVIKWETINSSLYKSKEMPVHVIRYGESKDGISWKTFPEICIDFDDKDEFGFGRPWVIQEDGLYKMWYSIRNRNKPYSLGYAQSHDGKSWKRMDDILNLQVSDSGWDSEMVCFCSIIKIHNRTLIFYNGNNYGETGFGYAELVNQL